MEATDPFTTGRSEIEDPHCVSAAMEEEAPRNIHEAAFLPTASFMEVSLMTYI